MLQQDQAKFLPYVYQVLVPHPRPPESLHLFTPPRHTKAAVPQDQLHLFIPQQDRMFHPQLLMWVAPLQVQAVERPQSPQEPQPLVDMQEPQPQGLLVQLLRETQPLLRAKI